MAVCFAQDKQIATRIFDDLKSHIPVESNQTEEQGSKTTGQGTQVTSKDVHLLDASKVKTSGDLIPEVKDAFLSCLLACLNCLHGTEYFTRSKEMVVCGRFG